MEAELTTEVLDFTLDVADRLGLLIDDFDISESLGAEEIDPTSDPLDDWLALLSGELDSIDELGSELLDTSSD